MHTTNAILYTKDDTGEFIPVETATPLPVSSGKTLTRLGGQAVPVQNLETASNLQHQRRVEELLEEIIQHLEGM